MTKGLPPAALPRAAGVHHGLRNLFLALVAVAALVGIALYVNPWVAVGAFAIVLLVLPKTVQKLQGHDRCQACGARLKYANHSYASTCRRCGARQSWARR